jgi:anti-anti-sigma factor
MDALTYAVEVSEQATTVRLYGDLAMDTIDGLRHTVSGLEWSWLIVDLQHLRLCDSTGLNYFLSVHRFCGDTGRKVSFLNVSDGARRVFAIAGLDDLLDLN